MGDSEDRVPGNVGSVVVSTVGPDGAWVEAVHPQADFEQSEHGAIFGRLVIPWPRVVRISWSLPSIEGEELVVASERFDITPWAAGLLVDDVVDADLGLVSQRRILVPWHAVREYERTTASVVYGAERLVPSRPDAQL